MKVCFTTWYLDCKNDFQQMRRSLEYFHPDIPLEVFHGERVENDIKKSSLGLWILFAKYGRELSEKYDLVVHLDCDIIVTGKLDELLKGDFDVAAPLNCSHFGISPSGVPMRTGEVGPDIYVNAGTHAVTRKQFWVDWDEMNEAYARRMPYKEQDTLNLLFHSGKYNAKILDPIDGSVFYGLSSAWNGYGSWKGMQIDGDDIVLNGKKVKLLHYAGGGLGRDNKFDFDGLFSIEVADRLRKITG